MSNENFALEDLGAMIKKLKEVLDLKKNEINRDSAIKRFELCFDLAWKSIKISAKNKGIECYSPVDCFKSAFQLKIIEHDSEWLDMVRDRNSTVHIYKEEYANEVYLRLPAYLKLYETLLENLKKAE